MAKTKKPSKQQLRKILSASAFNPREPGPFQIVADVGNPEYYETRAIEFIKEKNLHSAIALLALALAVAENEGSNRYA